MIRPLRLASSALLVLSAIGLPAAARAATSRADAGPVNAYFSGLVSKGPDAGTQLSGLLSLTNGAGTLTLGNGAQAPVTASMGASGMRLTATLAPGKVVHGSGAMAGKGAIAGTFTGPAAGDSGVWTADIAVSTVNLGVTGTITKGPNLGKDVLIGDLFGYVDAMGMMHGTYTDNSKVGPGITPKVYPAHGSYMNKLLTASIAFSPMQSFALVGRSGKFYGIDRVAGTVYGPTSQDSGTWAGVSQ